MASAHTQKSMELYRTTARANPVSLAPSVTYHVVSVWRHAVKMVPRVYRIPIRTNVFVCLVTRERNVKSSKTRARRRNVITAERAWTRKTILSAHVQLATWAVSVQLVIIVSSRNVSTGARVASNGTELVACAEKVLPGRGVNSISTSVLCSRVIRTKSASTRSALTTATVRTACRVKTANWWSLRRKKKASH